MLKRKLLPLILLLSCLTARAYDFFDTLPSGQVLYFSYVSGGVEVVYPAANVSSGWVGYTKPTGALTVPATVTHGGTTYAVLAIGDYAFRQCTGLTSVTLADGIASVGGSAFYGCSGITTLSLSASISSIGAAAFSSLSSLTDVWMWSTVPPQTSATAFYSVDLSECTLHVPCNAASAYTTAPWNAFDTVVEGACAAYIATAVNDPARGYVTGAGSYVPGSVATLTAIPAEGYAFICWNDGDTLNPRDVQVVSDSMFKAMFFTQPAPIHVHDTIHDTLVPTFYSLNVLSTNTQLGVGVGTAVLPAGTVVEVCGLPLEGARFVAWDDGNNDNPRQLTLTGNLTLSAVFETLSVQGVAESPWTVVSVGKGLRISGVGDRQVRVYDMEGRLLYSTVSLQVPQMTVRVQAAGAYLVRVGDGPARKVIVN